MIALALAPSFFAPVFIAPVGFTQPVASDADDPAVWRDARRPEFSQILGTDKAGAGAGALYVFGLDGRVLQRLGGLDRPNNVDVAGDLAVVTERERSRLKIFRIDPKTHRWRNITGVTSVFTGATGDAALPMGVALRKTPDGRTFAYVSRKSGPTEGYLGMYELKIGTRVDARFVRSFGTYSGKKEIESVAVDHATGDVYYSDETFGTRRYAGDPLREEEIFNTTGFVGDHEGIAMGSGLLVCTDQIEGDSIYHLYPLKPGPKPRVPLASFRGGIDATDGIEVCDQPLGPRFPRGVMAAMDSRNKRFALFDWGVVKTLIYGQR